jgi:hypothetical protein
MGFSTIALDESKTIFLVEVTKVPVAEQIVHELLEPTNSGSGL